MEIIFILVVLSFYMIIQGILMVMILIKTGDRKIDENLVQEITTLSLEVAQLKEIIIVLSKKA